MRPTSTPSIPSARRLAGRLAMVVAGAVALTLRPGIGAARAQLAIAQPSPNAPAPPSTYWMAGRDGSVYSFGNAPSAGSEAGKTLTRPIVGMAGVPNKAGYWLVASDGGIFSFGNASFYGSTGAIKLNRPIVGMAATPDGAGYWLVASDGGIFTFGDAGFFGSTGALKLAEPIVAMMPTPNGLGYWLVASDGGVFTFGDAGFFGSTGAIKLAEPIVGAAATPDGLGYWLVASDGGIFSFGDARFFGSLGATKLNAPIIGMATPADGGGYWLAAADGGIFNFGDAGFKGSLGGTSTKAPIVAVATATSLDPYQPGATGYDISWPQCGGSYPQAPFGVAVVGVNDGKMFTQNPCLSSEATWGEQAVLTLYINTNSPTADASSQAMSGPAGNCAATDANCQSYNYGYNAAKASYQYAQQAGAVSPMWWLDVETANNWSTDTAANDQVIAGAVAALQAAGVQPGVYSTPTSGPRSPATTPP